MRRIYGAIAVALVLAMFGASCSDDSEGSTTDAGTEVSTESTTTSAPKDGGTLSVGVFSEVTSLDPILSGGTGFTGGSEQAALYDQLVVYDRDSETYTPHTAASLEPNDDNSQWTLELRPGITFSDGTPYDAAAVKLNIERHASAKSQSQFKGVVANDIKEIEVVDALTVRFTLASPWSGFPVVLASAPGRIVSPTAIQSLGDGLSTNPVGAGAGPFVLESFRPNEALVLKKNPSYWGDEPHLDQVRFVFLGGGSATYEALEAETVDLVVLRDAEASERAIANGFDGIDTPIAAANVLQINSGVTVTCTGGKPEALCAGQADGTKAQSDTPGVDVKVRQAVAAAIDPDVVNERAYDGQGTASSALIPPGFPWDPHVDGPAYDPDRARQLVTEAKANGWDGQLRLLVQNAGAPVPTGDAVEALLRAVGIDVVKDATKDTPQVIRQVFVNSDYDTVTWGYAMTPDDLLYLNLVQNLTGRYGYSSPEMNEALESLRTAETTDEKVDALASVSKVWAKDVPAVALVHFSSYVAWSPRVHGVETTSGVTTLLGNAWVE